MTKAANLSALGSNVTTAGNISSASTLTLQTNSTTAITVDSSQRAAFVAGTAALPAITTAGDTNTGIFFPAADTIAFAEGGAESMRIDSSGNVGIGTTSPTAKLQIGSLSGSNATYVGDIQINAQPTSLAQVGGLEFKTSTFGSGYGWKISSIDSSGVQLVFGTRQNSATWTEAMRIDPSGNVGIGTTSMTRKLEISGASAAGASIEVGNTNTQSSTVAAINTTGTTYSYAGVGGSTSWYYGNKTVALGTDSANPIQFVTNASERMRIDSSGNVLVGTASSPSGSNNFRVANRAGFGWNYYNADSGDFVVTVTYGTTITQGISMITSATSGTNAAIRFIQNGGTVGVINTTNTATAYVTSSDYRLKENIAPMTGALDTVAQLKPVTYKWKSDGSDGQGFIAHELQAVVPDAVVGEKDDVDEDGNIKPQGIDTSFLVATLTAAIQEQQTIINDLTARIKTLEGK